MSITAIIQQWKNKLGARASGKPETPSSELYFPQVTLLYNPVLSSLHTYRQEQSLCSLLLIRLRDYDLLTHTYSDEFITELKSQMKHSLQLIVQEHVPQEYLIGMKQYSNEDYCIFLKDVGVTTFEALNKLSYLISSKLEQALVFLCRKYSVPNIQLLFSSSFIDPSEPDTDFAVQNAYYHMRSLASDKIFPNYNPYKQELENILNEQNITVLAQPIMNLQTGEVFGWEILTRGPRNSPLFSPTELFEFAFQADLLIRMECLVIEQAFLEISKRQIKEQVFINVTSVSLNHPIFLGQLMKMLEGYPDIHAHQIIFEITERHAIKDFHEMGLVIQQYRAHGFRFAVDDAGAGYSSLLTISELIPDMIKIDKSVIQNIDQISVKRSILKALLSFAQDMKCQVIAEGVEREEEAEVLYHHDVQMGQGYYFARPGSFFSKENRVEMQAMQHKIRQSRQRAAK